MKRTLAIWLPNWPIQRLWRDRNERAALEFRPLILQRRSRRGQCVVACSPAAWQIGIRPDMPVAEARALVRKPPEGGDARPKVPQLSAVALDVRNYDPHGDRQALEKLAAWCYRFSPLVGLDDADPPETLLLDIQYVTDLFDSESSLVNRLNQALSRMQLRVRIGVACTIGAAWAVAHFGAQHVVIIPPDGQRDAMENLPIAALRISPPAHQRLERLGLQQIGQLFSLPRSAMQSRFGSTLLQRLDQALGAAPELIEAVHPPLEFQTDWLFENPINHRQTIDHVIKQLVQRLSQMLIDHHRGALQLTCRISCQDAAMREVTVGLFRPSADAAHLLKLLEMHLEQVILAGAVTKIAIVATVHATLDDHQSPLFDQPQRQHNSAVLGSVIDRVAGRLGRDTVVRCVPQKDAQPERAFRYEPVIGSDSFFTEKKKRPSVGKTSRALKTSKPRTAEANDAYPLNLCPLDRPLHLLPKPIAINVHAVVVGGPPHDFVWHNERHKIARLWGPERIETGWWRRQGIRRDYYRVETKTGHRYWLFQCLNSKRWYLHGAFR